MDSAGWRRWTIVAVFLLCAMPGNARSVPRPLNFLGRPFLKPAAMRILPIPAAAPAVPPSADKQWKHAAVRILVEDNCALDAASSNSTCTKTLLELCHALSEPTCYAEAARTHPACRATRFPTQPAEAWWMSAMNTIVPQLRKHGWTDVQVVKHTGDDAIPVADVLILQTYNNMHIMRQLLDSHNTARKIILVDPSASGTLAVLPGAQAKLMESDKVLAILKRLVVTPSALQNGPLVVGQSHLGALPGHPNTRDYRHVPRSVIDKVSAPFPPVFEFSAPLACGGRLNLVRYAGFFDASLQHHWTTSQLQERPYDLAFFGSTELDDGVGGVFAHQKLMLAAVQSFRERHPHYRIFVAPPQHSQTDYQVHLGLLRSTKMVISPWGRSEMEELDIEAVLSGCLLVKPGLARFSFQPPLFIPNVTAVNLPVDASGLADAVLPLLHDLPAAQKMVDAAQAQLKRISDPALAVTRFSDWLTGLLDQQASHSDV